MATVFPSLLITRWWKSRRMRFGTTQVQGGVRSSSVEDRDLARERRLEEVIRAGMPELVALSTVASREVNPRWSLDSQREVWDPVDSIMASYWSKSTSARLPTSSRKAFWIQANQLLSSTSWKRASSLRSSRVSKFLELALQDFRDWACPSRSSAQTPRKEQSRPSTKLAARSRWPTERLYSLETISSPTNSPSTRPLNLQCHHPKNFVSWRKSKRRE